MFFTDTNAKISTVSKTFEKVAVAKIVYDSRRITIPQDLGRKAFSTDCPRVVWSVAGNSRRSLMLHPARAEDGGHQRSFARTVTRQWQVTIPQPLMTAVGIAVREWVYLQLGADKHSLRVTAARYVSVQVPTGLETP